MKCAPAGSSKGFTLIEILLASIAAALILVSVYGIFQHAVKMRDSATQRIRDSRLRARAAKVIRNDLRNALVSGGVLASTVQGDSTGTGGMNSGFPGYLKFTTTTAKDTPDNLYGDVQQVEYYIVKYPAAAGLNQGGNLVRAVTRDLLQSVQPEARQEQILSGVQSLEVSFYDGANWQSSWSFNSAAASSTSTTTASQTLPEAIRVDIQPAAPTAGGPSPAPVEVLVPWTTQPFTSPTPAPSATPS